MKTNDQDPDSGCVEGGPLLWLRLEGLCIFILTIILYAYTGASWWRFVALLLVPDVVMAGYWLDARWGAVVYNFGHSYVSPIALMAFAIAYYRADWLPYLMIWTAHIAMDRGLGYGLKYAAGFKKTHLGWLGKKTGRISPAATL
jgi:hypothetical protein